MSPSRLHEQRQTPVDRKPEDREKDLHQKYQEKYNRIDEKLHLKAQEEYCRKQKEKGVQVEFPKGRAVEGVYHGVKEVDGREYAVIDTHADLSKGTRYMIPYDKKYDQMMRHRHVAYDGQKMAYVQQKDLERNLTRDIGKNKGPGFER